MTTVWTATNLRRQDGRYNSLSRSLGSLMSIVLDEDKSPSVLIFSSQPSRENNLQSSVSVGDRVGDENILQLNEPSFRSLQTDSSSSIAFIGKKIKREYQSAFVLPDKQTVGIVRQEAFMTEEGIAQVTLSLCVSNHFDNLKVSKGERICDYLDTDYWASILLAYTESHDAELLGYMAPEYTSRRPNRFNFERSESRRRKREIVLVQEEIEDDGDRVDTGINILPESVTVFEKVYPKEKDERTSCLSPVTPHPPPPPIPQNSHLPSPSKTSKAPEKHTPSKPQLVSSRILSQPKEQAPIIGRAEPPGKNKPIISSPKSKENFEELKRQWNNRIAQMQEHLDNQYRDTLPATMQNTEGHRGSVVTSILPTVDNRSSDPVVKSRIPPPDHKMSTEQIYDHQSLLDRTSMDAGSNKENFLSHNGFHYTRSPSPGSGDLVNPVTERCEKDAQFIYSQARLFVNQQNIGRLSPRSSETDPTNYRKMNYADIHYKVDDPSIDRKEKFMKKLTKYKASSEIDDQSKINRILLDIDQNYSSPISIDPQLYPSSTDISSLLSPVGDHFKGYFNKYVERSEKYWSLPKSYIILDEPAYEDKPIRINKLKDLTYDDFKSQLPTTTSTKVNIQSTTVHDSDNLHLFYLKPYKPYTTTTTTTTTTITTISSIQENDTQLVEGSRQDEKIDTDNILNNAFHNEINRMRRRQSLKIDNFSSTSSLSILAKVYEEHLENNRKHLGEKSTSVKRKGSKTTDDLREHKSLSTPKKQMNEQETTYDDPSKMKQNESPSDRQLKNSTSGNEVEKPGIRKSSKHQVTPNLPKPEIPQHSEVKTGTTDQIIISDKISEKPQKDQFSDEKSKQQESKHHRHPPPPLHHQSSTKDDNLKSLGSARDRDKRACDGPVSFEKFKKDIISANLPKNEEYRHRNQQPTREESTVFSRDSKFRKPIHNTDDQRGTGLMHKHSLKDKQTDKNKNDSHLKSVKQKTQPSDTEVTRHSEQHHDKAFLDQKRDEQYKPDNKTYHQSLRSKRSRPHGSISTNNDRITSWVENSRHQTKQLLQDGEIGMVPDTQSNKRELRRHQSLNENQYSDRIPDNNKYRHSEDPSGKPLKKDSKCSDQIIAKLPKSHDRSSDPNDLTKPLDNKRESLHDTQQKFTNKKQQQVLHNKENVSKLTDTRKKDEKHSPNIEHKQHSTYEPKKQDSEKFKESSHHLIRSNLNKIKQPLKENRRQSQSPTKEQQSSPTKDHDDDNRQVNHRQNVSRKLNDKDKNNKITSHSNKSIALHQEEKRANNVPYLSDDRHLTTPERRSKVDDELPGHRRHPPPPLSPTSKNDLQYPRDAIFSRPKIPDDSQAAPLIPTKYSSKYPSDDLEKRGRRRQKSYEDEFKTSYKEPPVVTDPRKSTIPFHPSDILQHPDEYNYLAEAEKKKPSIDYTSELSYDSSLYGKTSQGSTRKQPPMKHSDEHKNKNGEPVKSHRHPPPPQPVNNHSRPKRFDEKSSPKMDRKSGHGITPADENHYVNIPGSISPGTRPSYNGYKISLQDLSERSGPHSVYDPRLGDEHVPSDKPKTNGRISSDQIVDHQYDQYTSDESDYDDSGESDEELKPPALRTIAQTKRKSEPEPQNNFPPVQLRRPPKGQKTGQSITSLRGSLISPEGMSIPSTPGYENIYGNYYDDKTGKYMKGPYRGHSTGLSQERISRPRSKHSTATSQSPGYQGIAGSKHSLIISTKRRTLSGITGAHPSKHRSSSMNTLWFGDHPVPSERTLSPATPIKLSNIQIQAQAELDRRHRSSSHGHSLDRKSTYSTGITESHLSRGLSDYQGYEGIGYAYDNRGRLIHGGACLPERSASRKRRLLDGHESLSRVWIPQGEHYPVKQISNKTTGLLTNREQLQAQLDDSAMAFALRDYNLPKIRQKRATNRLNGNTNKHSNNDNNMNDTINNVLHHKLKTTKKLQCNSTILKCCMR